MRKLLGALLLASLFGAMGAYMASKAGVVVVLQAFGTAIGITAIIALAVWLLFD